MPILEYSVSDFPAQKVVADKLIREIQAAGVAPEVTGISTDGDLCEIEFATEPNTSDIDLLRLVIAAHEAVISKPQAQLYLGDQSVSGTTDGRIEVRVTAAKKTSKFKLRFITFYTSKANSQESGNPITGQPHGDVTLTLQKWSGTTWVAATDADAERTVVDWDPLYSFEIIGGWADIPTALKDGTTDAWSLSCVAAPDYAIYGLAVDFVSDVNLEAVMSQRVVINGRAVQYLAATIVDGVNYYTNRLRFTTRHPAGAQLRFQIAVENFV